MAIKMPLYAELSGEQLSILEDAELDENLMVVGPPGTGKTVIAMWRANQECSGNSGGRATLIMYNVVLVSYSGQWDEQHAGVEVKTYHSWAGHMWQQHFRKWPPHIPGGTNWDLDWTQMAPQLTELHIEMGHLIVDEAQDFPPEFFVAMGMVTALDPASTICVVADENQRLDAQSNSSINQIRNSLGSLGELPENALTKNYRNTKEIAALASCFYVGLQTGIALPPGRSGSMPCMIAKDDLNEMVNAICTYSRNNPGHSILVIADKSLKKCFNKIKHQLRDAEIKVEGYKSNKDKEKSYLHGNPNLHTGDGGTVTCVHWRSMKGLEADAVFVPEFEEHNMGGDGSTSECMRLYVMFSRARNYLEVQYKKATPLVDPMLTMMRAKAGETLEWK